MMRQRWRRGWSMTESGKKLRANAESGGAGVSSRAEQHDLFPAEQLLVKIMTPIQKFFLEFFYLFISNKERLRYFFYPFGN